MTALAPALQAFFTDRLIAPATRHPPHHRRLPRHVPAAARLRHRQDRQDAIGAGHRRPRRAADRRVPGPPRASTGTTRSAPATGGSPPSTRCSATPRCATPNTPPLIQRVLAIPTKRHDRRLVSPGSPTPRSTRCSPHPTAARGPAGATTPCSSLAVQTGLRISELIGLPRGDVALDTGAHVRCTAKDARNAPRRSPPHRRRRCAAGSPSTAGQTSDPLFPTRTGTRLSHDAIERRSHATSPPPRRTAHRWPPSTSPCTPCGTPAPCASSTPASTSPSSPSGSATNTIGTTAHLPPRRPRHQRTRPRAIAPAQARPAATAPRTRCSPSSRPCDYANSLTVTHPQRPAPTSPSPRRFCITVDST